MSRQDATDLLMGERDGGVFLVRDSTTILGDFVLCVRYVSRFRMYRILCFHVCDYFLMHVKVSYVPGLGFMVTQVYFAKVLKLKSFSMLA